jgi:hypothetical protein
MIDEENAKRLALFGITLKNETSSYAILQLKNFSYDSKMSQPLFKRLLSTIESYKLSSLKLPKVTFGVELEFVGSADLQALFDFNTEMARLLRDRYFYTGKYSHNNGHQWILGKDSSIKYNELDDEFGYELSSAKLNLFNEYDVLLLKNVLSCIDRYLHGRVNDSCGTHIHIGFSYDGLYKSDVRDILHDYSCMEEIALDPLVPSNRRRNTYCKSTQSIISEKYQKLSARYCDFSEVSLMCDSLRFESRQLEGTLDLTTILNWAILQSYIVYDIASHLQSTNYIKNLIELDAFQILFRYNLNSDCINFFLDRIIKFRSRKLSAYCKSCI